MSQSSAAHKARPGTEARLPWSGGSFAGWKLDFMRGIRVDKRLTHADRSVAGCIIDHINQLTGITAISDKLIALETCNSVRTVQRSRARLRATGWIDMQKTRTSSLSRALVGNMPAMAERLAKVRQEVREGWQEPAASNETRPANHDVRPATCDAEPSPMADRHTSSSLRGHPLGREFDQSEPETNNTEPSQPTNRMAGRKEADDRPGSTAPPEIVDAKFDRLMQVYPKRDGANPRVMAKEEFIKALKTGADPDEVIAGARWLGIVEQKRIGTQYIPMTATWLRNRRWLDHADKIAAEVARSKLDPNEAKRQAAAEAAASWLR